MRREIRTDKAPPSPGDVLNVESLTAVIDSMPIGVYVLDGDGNLVYGNKAGSKIWKGLAYVGTTDFHEYKAWWHDTGERIGANDWAGSRAIQKGETSVDERIRIQCFDGSYKTILNSASPIRNGAGEIIGAFATNQDITEQKAYEQKLKDSEYRFRSTLDNLLEGVQIIDWDWRYLYLNDAAERHNRRPRQELIGNLYMECWPGIDRTEVFSLIEDTLMQRVAHKMENNFSFPSGSAGWFALSIQPVAEGVLILSVDITESKRMAMQQERNQRLESLGFLAAGIAHDFNNLFGGIYGNMDLALTRSNNPDVVSALRRSVSTIDQARSLTQRLITFSKGGAPRCQPGDLFPTIQRVVERMLQPTSMAAQFEMAPDLPQCNFDVQQISQVVESITRNALEATANTATLLVSAAKVSLEAAVAPRLTGDYLRLSFTNNGPSISEDVVEKVFDPFFTTHEHGRGLGLSTAHSIIQQHHGSIEIAPAVGDGTTVTIYLPVYSPENDSIVPSKRKSAHKGAGRVLLMDDDETVRFATGAMLESFGYEVVSAEGGEDAFALFEGAQKENDSFMAVILDLTVPGGWGGAETVAAIRERDAQIPVFVASGYVDVPIMNDPVAHGFTASITKPFRLKELGRLLDTHILAHSE